MNAFLPIYVLVDKLTATATVNSSSISARFKKTLHGKIGIEINKKVKQCNSNLFRLPGTWMIASLLPLGQRRDRSALKNIQPDTEKDLNWC